MQLKANIQWYIRNFLAHRQGMRDAQSMSMGVEISPFLKGTIHDLMGQLELHKNRWYEETKDLRVAHERSKVDGSFYTKQLEAAPQALPIQRAALRELLTHQETSHRLLASAQAQYRHSQALVEHYSELMASYCHGFWRAWRRDGPPPPELLNYQPLLPVLQPLWGENGETQHA